MPRQNRVRPTGEIVRDSTRGLFMGNRGILHDAEQQVVKPYAHKAWIICQLQFKGRRRKLMQPGKYTELFFLDEATALAAGHRPCYECRREAAVAFRQAWLAGNAALGFGDSIRATELDKIMQAKRLTDEYYAKNKRQRRFTAVLPTLPNGTIILHNETPHLIWQDVLLPWTPDGYADAVEKPTSGETTVLTPRSIVNALAHGYADQLIVAV